MNALQTAARTTATASVAGPYPIIDWQHWVQNNQTRSAGGGSAVNAPNTLPLLDLPPIHAPGEQLSRFQVFFRKSKEVVKIYKSGITNVWKNRKLALAVYKRLGDTPGPTGELVGRVLASQAVLRAEQDARSTAVLRTARDDVSFRYQVPDASGLSRAEFQLVRRARRDFLKLPLFTLIFCVLFEMTPLVVALVPDVVPAICVLPPQVRAGIARTEQRLAALQTGGAIDMAALQRTAPRLARAELAGLAKALELVPSWAPAGLYTSAYLQRRLAEHMAYLKADNALIGQWGGVWAMSAREVETALLERAIPIAGKSLEAMRFELYTTAVNMAVLRLDAGYLLTPRTLAADDVARLAALRELTFVDAAHL
ncbi:uncharacterized protein V1510DRAFT_400608 [Dipodascopsis tothii]|uniref:uncharacterized protein n=1 Tax=Dipodascopsis tothii TaxID=44089 RepID=UPI0034CFBB81